ncbi:MAG TPA: hypothetical protein DCQ28_13595 [Bacteroidetes bacterium]|nr:hypothetical protein [Bacteroidota bacterium]
MTIQLFDKTSDEPVDKLSRIYGMLFFAALLLGFASTLLYRKYISSNHIYDFGLADSLPNFFAVFGFSYLMLFHYQKKVGKTSPHYFFISALSMIAYEISQRYESGTFDIRDIIASIIGSVVAYGVYVILNKK